MRVLPSAWVAAASAVAAALVVRRILRRRRPADACACGCAPRRHEFATPSKRGAARAATPASAREDATPPRHERLHSDPYAVTKRESNLSWHEYFMAVAFLSAQRSKDPNRQVGACVVNGDLKIVGIGYNGFPWGCSDDDLPWAKKGESLLDTKYPYVCHAELNAIMNANSKTLKVCARGRAALPASRPAAIPVAPCSRACRARPGWRPRRRGRRAARSTSRSTRATSAPN